MTNSQDFSLQALHDALDTARQMRHLSWAAVAREMNGHGHAARGHQLSASTVTATRTGRVAEGDGVLQMLRWLKRSPESFFSDSRNLSDEHEWVPKIPVGSVLRFDTRKLHTALDAERKSRQLTWAQVGAELGLGASTLTRLAKGGRTAFPHVMRMTRWLGQPVADFTKASPR